MSPSYPTPIARRNKRTLYIRLVTIVGIIIYGSLSLYTARYMVLTLIPVIGFLMLPAYPRKTAHLGLILLARAEARNSDKKT
ncbi:MAG: hypothetical protein GSR79_03470 [Desulfurococcales archaeon]|nr:hypothetical protein [Desulfurococcales archaeon]